jgi:cell division transport system permease protein
MGMMSTIRLRLRSWSRRHSYSFFSSLGALFKHRIGTMMTVLVLGIAILLPLGLYIALENLDRLDLQQDEWGAISVFIQPGTSDEAVRSFSDDVEARPSVSSVELVSPEQGMSEFRESSGFGLSLELLDENPLPWVLMINPAVTGGDPAPGTGALGPLMAFLEKRPEVQSVQYDHKWLQRLGRMLELGRATVAVLTFLFSLAVVVVVANTIRLDVAARAEEIEILALVGAGNSFIRQPFLYSGLWYGMMGGALAAVLMKICLFYLGGPLTSLIDSYGHGVSIYGMGTSNLLILVAASGLLGMMGAWVSVQRYLRILQVGGTLGRR